MDPSAIYLNTSVRGVSQLSIYLQPALNAPVPYEIRYLGMRSLMRLKERLKHYETGTFCPIHLGDVLNDRYSIFRKLGSGSQCTVWLARDRSAPSRRFVAIKVFSTRSTDGELEIAKLLGPSRGLHSGEQHIELALDTFFVQGPNGRHLCKVVEPLGCSLYSVLDQAFEKRSSLNEPEPWLQRVVDGDTWSVRFAKRACWQILQGLDYLHSQRIAHRDLHTGNVCGSLQYDLSSLGENEIQGKIWPATKDESSPSNESSSTENCASEKGSKPAGPEDQNAGSQPETLHAEAGHADSDSNSDSDSDSDSDSESDSDSDSASLRSYDGERKRSRAEFQKRLERCQKIAGEQWRALESNLNNADRFADPHSTEWNRANLVNSRRSIELLVRADGKPIEPNRIRYIVAPTCLADGFDLDDEQLKLVLVDLGLACKFEDCEKNTRADAGIVDFMSPEWLMGFPTTHKGDIFSLGLIFWELIMLRRLVEYHPDFDETGRLPHRIRLVRDLAHRLGPIPDDMWQGWKDAYRALDAQGKALGLVELEGEEEEEEPGPDDYDYGDIWHHARRRKPLDMSDKELELFVDLTLQMMQWRPESRPATSELLRHEWFQNLVRAQ